MPCNLYKSVNHSFPNTFCDITHSFRTPFIDYILLHSSDVLSTFGFWGSVLDGTPCIIVPSFAIVSNPLIIKIISFLCIPIVSLKLTCLMIECICVGLAEIYLVFREEGARVKTKSTLVVH